MKKLDFIYLEITNVCNLSCPFCPQGKKEKGFLTKENFGAVLKKISGKAETLYFHVKGEPLLHPDLGTFLEMAGTAGFNVFLTTNGTLLQKRIGALTGRGSLKKVNISLQSLESLGEELRHASLLETLSGVRELLKLRAVCGTAPQVQLRLWNPMDFQYPEWFFGSLRDFYGTSKNTILDCIERQEGIILGEAVSLVPAHRFEWPDIKKAHAHSDGFCRALRHQAAILLDGTVVPCCLDAEGDISLGNIYRQPFDEILGGQRAAAMYQGFSRRKLVEDLCRTCGFARRFSLVK